MNMDITENLDNGYQFFAIPGYPSIVECVCGQPLDRIDTNEEIVCPECGNCGLQEPVV